MPDAVRIFIGYDSREPLAYHVLCHSILRRASGPVSITPLVLGQLRHIYSRQRGPTESTEFSMTRFLVPYLCDYKGTAIFMDCDMLCRHDIYMLLKEVDDSKPVSVCQHDYIPSGQTKFLGQQQTSYPRKNWSSLMVFNMAHFGCRALTPQYVNEASGLDLHRLNWADGVGRLPLEWNWLVGEYPKNHNAKMLHYTLGGPWFPEYRDCDHADLWRNELRSMNNETGNVVAQ